MKTNLLESTVPLFHKRNGKSNLECHFFLETHGSKLTYRAASNIPISKYIARNTSNQTYLRAQCRFFMEASTDKHAVFWCCNFTLAPYSNATWMPYHFAHHVLSRMTVSTVFQLFHVHFTPANWPFCDVIWPYIGSYRGRGLTEPENVRIVVLD